MSSLVASATATAAQAALSTTQQIKPGASIPDIPVKENEPDKSFSLANLLGKNIIIGVPGAFTTPCNAHIPEYIEHYHKFIGKGVTGIFVVAVNDVFVTKAWKEKLAPEGTPIRFIADDQCTFSTAVGLVFDGTALLGAPRSKRYALIVQDGKVTDVYIEAVPTDIILTKAETLLTKI